MSSYLNYNQLNTEQRDWVKANFGARLEVNAYYYELGLNGQVICRHRKERFDAPVNLVLSPDALRQLTGEFPLGQPPSDLAELGDRERSYF